MSLISSFPSGAGGGGATFAYIVGSTPLASDWLSETVSGSPLTPDAESIYLILTEGEYYHNFVRWNTPASQYVIISASNVVYQPGGSFAFASLPSPAKSNCGFVYNVTDAFTTTSDFLEGAGIECTPGTDVVVVNAGTTGSPSYKYNLFMGTLAGYQKKIQYLALPTADATNLGKIYQYMGATTSSYVHGKYYECVSDGASTPTYSWQVVPFDIVMDKDSFDALSMEEKNNGLTYYITDANLPKLVMSNRFDRGNIYTTSERMIGSWMGKPLYQKTYMLTGLTQSSNTIAHGLTNLDTIVYCFGSIRKSTDGSINPLDHADNYGNQYCVYLNVTKTNIIIDAHGYSGYSYDTGNVTIQYTKTTDSEIKIGSENDYSTEETWIGTWIDGKKLYQKTFVKETNLTSNGWNALPHGISGGIDTFVKGEAGVLFNNGWAMSNGGLSTSDFYIIVDVNKNDGGNTEVGIKSIETPIKVVWTLCYTKTTD